ERYIAIRILPYLINDAYAYVLALIKLKRRPSAGAAANVLHVVLQLMVEAVRKLSGK
ncbi:hypothetical protein ACJX0J_008088, partial [Zea mays]